MDEIFNELNALLIKYNITIDDAIRIYNEHKIKVEKAKEKTKVNKEEIIKPRILKQYSADNKDELMIYTTSAKNTLCTCSSTKYRKEYYLDKKEMYLICDKCSEIVYKINKDFINEHLSVGIWK